METAQGRDGGEALFHAMITWCGVGSRAADDE
jgi:hypothetical protein